MTLYKAVCIIYDSGLFTLNEINRMSLDRIMYIAHELRFPTVASCHE